MLSDTDNIESENEEEKIYTPEMLNNILLQKIFN